MSICKLIVRVLRVSLLRDIRHILNRYNRDIVVHLGNLCNSSNLHIEETAIDTETRLYLADNIGIDKRVASKYCLLVLAKQLAWVGNLRAEALRDYGIVVNSHRGWINEMIKYALGNKVLRFPIADYSGEKLAGITGRFAKILF